MFRASLTADMIAGTGEIGRMLSMSEVRAWCVYTCRLVLQHDDHYRFLACQPSNAAMRKVQAHCYTSKANHSCILTSVVAMRSQSSPIS